MISQNCGNCYILSRVSGYTGYVIYWIILMVGGPECGKITSKILRWRNKLPFSEQGGGWCGGYIW